MKKYISMLLVLALLISAGICSTDVFAECESGDCPESTEKTDTTTEEQTPQTGMVKIGDYTFYIAKDGTKVTGLKKVDGNWYYFNPKNGRLIEKAGWKKINGKKYYIQKGGILATGIKKIGKKKYAFTNKGVLRGFKKPFKYNGKWYRTSKKGVAEKLNNTQVKCSKETWKFINRYTTSKMSKKQKFRALFNRMEAGNYVPGCIARSQTDAKGFQYKIAYNVLSTNRYNCYGFACTVASIAKELGYEPYVIVMNYDHAVVRIDGKYYDNMGARFGAASPALSDFKIHKKVKF